ncbi:uncharacterized protein [Clytia hemisphaerica]|uniref:Uncharacterized protein n=1 Tax=Clytia hemisphaerica TaxID=252671 RepID=A0A7M5WUQ7_9CNID
MLKNKVFGLLLLLFGISHFTNADKEQCSSDKIIRDKIHVGLHPEQNSSSCLPYDPLTRSYSCPNLDSALKIKDKLAYKCIIVYRNQTITESHFLSSSDVFSLILTSNDTQIKIGFYNINVSLTFKDCNDIRIFGFIFFEEDESTTENNTRKALSFPGIQNLQIHQVTFNGFHGHALSISSMKSGVINLTEIQMFGIGGQTLSKGLYIELSGSDLQLIIKDSSFIQLSDQSNYTLTADCGKGAGVFILIRNKMRNSQITLVNNIFKQNKASFGSALYGEISGLIENVQIEVHNSSFILNEATFSGAGILFKKTKEDTERTLPINSLKLDALNFEGNVANKGKGAALSLWNLRYIIQKNEILNSKFMHNEALLAGDIYIVRGFTTLDNVNTSESKQKSSKNKVMNYGSIVVHDTKLTIHKAYMHDHKGSAIILDFSELYIQGQVRITNNTAFNGGGIALFKNSIIHLTDSSDLNIWSNTANESGGAVYVSPAYFGKCFFQNLHHFKGNVKLSFNQSPNGSAIYTKTLRGCAEYPKDMKSYQHIFRNLTNFTIDCSKKARSSCIATDANSIEVHYDEWNNTQPGVRFPINISMPDELGHEQSSPLIVSIEEGNVQFSNGTKFSVINKSYLPSFIGDPHNQFDLKIYSNSYLSTTLKSLKLHDCDWYQKFNPNKTRCQCKRFADDNVKCLEKELYTTEDKWVDGDTSYNCPKGYCTCHYNPLVKFCKYNKKSRCDETRKENSTLCSQCKEGLSVVAGSIKCYNCSGDHNGILNLFLITSVIDLLVVVGIRLLNYENYAAYLVPVIFSYRMVAPLLRDTPLKLCSIMRIIVSLFDRNEEGIDQNYICLTPGLNNLERYWFDFISIFSWPLVYLITSFIIWVLQISTRSCEKLKLKIPRDSQFRTQSIIAHIMFFEFLEFAFGVLHYISIKDEYGKWSCRVFAYADVEYHKGTHLPLAIVAWVVILVVLIYLFLSYYDDCFTKIKIFFRFQKICYKEGKSFYLIFRFVMFAGFLAFGEFYLSPGRNLLMTLVLMSLLAVQVYFMPYKNNWFNWFEIIILTNLILIGVLTEDVIDKDAWQACLIEVLMYIPFAGFVVWIIYFIHSLNCARKFRQWISSSTIVTTLHGCFTKSANVKKLRQCFSKAAPNSVNTDDGPIFITDK